MGTVPKGRFSFCLFCTGIRKMVSSQFPSVSVRGRSSVSAMSSRNDSGTFSVLVRNSKSSLFGHTTLTQLFGSHCAFSPLCRRDSDRWNRRRWQAWLFFLRISVWARYWSSDNADRQSRVEVRSGARLAVLLLRLRTDLWDICDFYLKMADSYEFLFRFCVFHAIIFC